MLSNAIELLLDGQYLLGIWEIISSIVVLYLTIYGYLTLRKKHFKDKK